MLKPQYFSLIQLKLPGENEFIWFLLRSFLKICRKSYDLIIVNVNFYLKCISYVIAS
jgi:hypothetical protein